MKGNGYWLMEILNCKMEGEASGWDLRFEMWAEAHATNVGERQAEWLMIIGESKLQSGGMGEDVEI